MIPVLGREMVEREQRVSILAQALGRLLLSQSVALDEGVERQLGDNPSFSAIQISCNPERHTYSRRLDRENEMQSRGRGIRLAITHVPGGPRPDRYRSSSRALAGDRGRRRAGGHPRSSDRNAYRESVLDLVSSAWARRRSVSVEVAARPMTRTCKKGAKRWRPLSLRSAPQQ